MLHSAQMNSPNQISNYLLHYCKELILKKISLVILRIPVYNDHMPHFPERVKRRNNQFVSTLYFSINKKTNIYIYTSSVASQSIHPLRSGSLLNTMFPPYFLLQTPLYTMEVWKETEPQKLVP